MRSSDPEEQKESENETGLLEWSTKKAPAVPTNKKDLRERTQASASAPTKKQSVRKKGKGRRVGDEAGGERS